MMKKLISVLLVLTMLFTFPAVIAYATEGEYQTFYISYEVQNKGCYIQPLEGYEQYVTPGSDFRFTIEVERNADGEPKYTNAMAIVEANHKTIEPDEHGIYTISNINEDVNILVYLTFEQDKGNLAASILVMLKQMFRVIIDVIRKILISNKT